MKKIFVSGLVNIETTLKVQAFPITYEPVRYPVFGIDSTVSGVGFNITQALQTLGDEVRFLSFIGNDFLGNWVHQTLLESGIDSKFVIKKMHQTAQSVVIYNSEGKRQIHTDLKNAQDLVHADELYEQAIVDCDLAILTNINFSRPFVARIKERGIPIATDVQGIKELENDYNQDFMAAADILFMSDEELPCGPIEWAKSVQEKYGTGIVVIGRGKEGALLSVKEDRFIDTFPAVQLRPVVSTVGAGDALFSAFNHFYVKTKDPYISLQKAILFASYKIGASGGAMDFLTESEIEVYFARTKTLRFSTRKNSQKL